MKVTGKIKRLVAAGLMALTLVNFTAPAAVLATNSTRVEVGTEFRNRVKARSETNNNKQKASTDTSSKDNTNKSTTNKNTNKSDTQKDTSSKADTTSKSKVNANTSTKAKSGAKAADYASVTEIIIATDFKDDEFRKYVRSFDKGGYYLKKEDATWLYPDKDDPKKPDAEEAVSKGDTAEYTVTVPRDPDDPTAGTVQETRTATATWDNNTKDDRISEAELTALRNVKIFSKASWGATANINWVADFTGIEYFTGLTTFTLQGGTVNDPEDESYVKAQTLNFDNLPNLETVTVENCIPLSTVTLTNNPKLGHVTLNNNSGLTKLTTSGNTGFVNLICTDNTLNELDLKESHLQNIEFSGNKNTKALNLAQCVALQNIDVQDNPALETLSVPKTNTVKTITCQNNAITKLDAQGLDSLETLTCYNNMNLTTLDVSNDKKLKTLEAYGNVLTDVSFKSNDALETLNLSNNELTQIDLSEASKVQDLNLQGNQLSALNLKPLTAVKTVNFGDNGVFDFTLPESATASLTTLICNDNKLVNLDLRAYQNLTKLDVTNNALATLKLENNFSKGNIQGTQQTAQLPESAEVQFVNNQWRVDLADLIGTSGKPKNTQYVQDMKVFASGLGFADANVHFSADTGLLTIDGAKQNQPTSLTYQFVTQGDVPPGETGAAVDPVVMDVTVNLVPIHTVTFDLDGGSIGGNGNNLVYNIQQGDKVSAPATPTKSGYKFTGWYQGSTRWSFDTMRVEESMTLKAGWSTDDTEAIKQVDVTINYNNGTGTSRKVTAYSGEKLEKPDLLEYDGYVFDKWVYRDNGGIEQVWRFENSTVPYNMETLTIDARWIAEEDYVGYRAIFNYNDGTDKNVSQKVDLGDTLIEPNSPTREGYTFTGWYDISLTNQWNFAKTVDISDFVDKKLQLYAKWEVTSGGDNTPDPDGNLTVTFDSNGGSTVAAGKVKPGEKVAKPTDPTRDGYTFDGWYTEATGGTAYNFDSPVTVNMTLYAHWKQNDTTTDPEGNYTVTFNSQGGSAVTSQTVKPNARATRPTNPTRTGYTFNGWYTSANGTTQYDFNTPVTSNITLYAQWTDNNNNNNDNNNNDGNNNGNNNNNNGNNNGNNNTGNNNNNGTGNNNNTNNNRNTYTVTFDSMGGSTVSNQTVTAGSTAKPPANPTRSGYIFAGWYTDKGYNSKFDFSTAINANMTLYAKWEKIGGVTVAKTSDDYSMMQNAGIMAASLFGIIFFNGCRKRKIKKMSGK